MTLDAFTVHICLSLLEKRILSWVKRTESSCLNKTWQNMNCIKSGCISKLFSQYSVDYCDDITRQQTILISWTVIERVFVQFLVCNRNLTSTVFCLFSILISSIVGVRVPSTIAIVIKSHRRHTETDWIRFSEPVIGSKEFFKLSHNTIYR